MAKILLLGAGGMLGTALADILAREHEIAAFTKSTLDITDIATLKQKFEKVQPAIVVNAAAYTAVDDCETNEELATKINGTAVGDLAELCAKSGARLIHFSTDYVFDGRNSAGYKEGAQPNPINAYGRSKLAGEQAILKSGGKAAIIRTSWLFGPGEKNFVDTMLRLGQEKSEIQVVTDQVGCPTFTHDLAAAVTELVQTDETGIFHLTNSGATSWADFATEIFRQAGLSTKVIPIKTSEFPRPAVRPQNSVLLNTKLPPLRPWQTALAEYLKETL